MPSSASGSAWRTAAAELAGRHDVASDLLERHGVPAPRRPTPAPARFMALASSIVHQQLAGRAAAAIWSRVVDTVGEPFTPASVLAIDPAKLRAAGLSGAKVAALIDLAAKVDDATVRLGRIGRLDDAAVVEHLTVVRGIGPWTAQMFLLFDLQRLDVWPTGDLGVRAGFARAFAMAELPTPADLEELGGAFAPYRSVLAWWCWREADTTTPGDVTRSPG